jgi:hypothetical protein
MQTIFMGIFFLLHGLVHLLYAGQSGRLFELRPQMVWPHGSWIFSKFLGDETVRLLASIFLVLAATGFIAGGLGIVVRQFWWRPVIVATAMFSSTLFFLLWDGKFQALAEKGGVGILISLAILVVVHILKWPA